ncbi:hypothetical protein HUB98_07190 [Paenibacillus barcinonensis]|uniref:DUF3606 domain-containing protein n=1 Tax=Paenibacillus barcinonensis TaxID=198119 RepID=A0ABX6Q1T8_PAEBA|nr:hypothetical protein [Paenibacillus barcinonensis]QKS56149.1 hypothetical protein HUB98_07190 [Paenibacillus barcinonensis]
MESDCSRDWDGHGKYEKKDYVDIRSVGMSDIEQVAKNTGMTVEEIKAMK